MQSFSKYERMVQLPVGRTKTKLRNMVWNVFITDMNSRKVEIHNVFNHSSFLKSVNKLLDAKLPKEEFTEQLRREVCYYYWCKVEWEITVSHYPSYIGKDEMDKLLDEREQYYRKYNKYPYSNDVDLVGAKRVDVHDQILLNWNAFVDYVWSQQ